MATTETTSDAQVDLLRQLSRQFSLEGNTELSEELELLENVYLDEMQLVKNDSDSVELLFHVTPSTGENANKKYVYLDLHLTLPQKYPHVPAHISTSQSRGLSDLDTRCLVKTLSVKAESLRGCAMIYELIECAKDTLTDNNFPCGECAVCLNCFHEDDVPFTKTECYHYFHTPCLRRYLLFFNEKLKTEELEEVVVSAPGPAGLQHPSPPLECPVCRAVISPGDACLEAVESYVPHSTSESEQNEVFISPKIREWQVEMARLLQRQRDRGGTIDLAAKDDTIDETWVRPVATKEDHKEAVQEAPKRTNKGRPHQRRSHQGRPLGGGHHHRNKVGGGSRGEQQHKRTCKEFEPATV